MKKILCFGLVVFLFCSSIAAGENYTNCYSTYPFFFVYPGCFEKQEDIVDGWTRCINAENGDEIRFKVTETDVVLKMMLAAFSEEDEMILQFIEESYWDEEEYGFIMGGWLVSGECYKLSADIGNQTNTYTTLGVCDEAMIVIQSISDNFQRRLDLALCIKYSLNVQTWPSP